MKSFFLLVFLANPILFFAQNLVPNGSFELYQTIPCKFITDTTDFNVCAVSWYIPTLGSSDLHSTISNINCQTNCYSTNPFAVGYQQPRSGNLMGGFSTYAVNLKESREYLSTKLTHSMIPNYRYHYRMFISKGDSVQASTNNISMLFSTEIITDYSTRTTLHKKPQITEKKIITNDTSWTEISGFFVSDSSYQYLTIGNFDSTSQTDIVTNTRMPRTVAYYYIDDISITTSCLSVPDSLIICKGDSAILEAQLYCTGTTISWSSTLDSNQILSTNTFLNIQPTTSQTYLLYTANPPDTHSVFVEVLNNDSVHIGMDTTICNGDSIILPRNSLHKPAKWSNGHFGSSLLIHESGYYWFEPYETNCLYSDTIQISVRYCDDKISMPNIFTPNGDGSNDLFYPINYQYLKHAELLIFNRWGQLVFNGIDGNLSWDGNFNGQQCSDGTYFYILSYSTSDNREHSQKGFLTLIR